MSTVVTSSIMSIKYLISSIHLVSTPLAYSKIGVIINMVIIETHVFTKLISRIISDESYRELQESLIIKPDSGVLIKHSGGLRKLRWSLDGRGKSAGARIIYYWASSKSQLFMLFVYPKNQQDTLSHTQLEALQHIVNRWSE